MTEGLELLFKKKINLNSNYKKLDKSGGYPNVKKNSSKTPSNN